MPDFTLETILSGPEGSFALSGVAMLEVVQSGGAVQVLAGSAASGALNVIALGAGNPARLTATFWHDSGAMPLSGGVVTGSEGTGLQLISGDAVSGQVSLRSLDAVGTPLLPQVLPGVSARALDSFAMAGQDWLATAPLTGGLALWRMDGQGGAIRTAGAAPQAKTGAGSIEQITTLETGQASYVITASAQANALSSYAVGPGGTLTHIDTITVHDGLWVSGLGVLETAEVAGASFVIAGASQSGSLAVLRLNGQGVFFVEDIVHDTALTRFGGVQAMDMFEVEGRDFLISAGNDGGFSLHELLPGGTLLHRASVAQDADWAPGAVAALSAVVIGGAVQVLASAGRGDGIAQFTMDAEDVAARIDGTQGDDRLSGGAGDDLILAGAGDDVLRAGAGKDVLIAGTGADTLSGGAGEDLFVFTADGGRDVIEDFEPGQDRIDLSGWGRLYDVSALDIRPRDNGAAIFFADEELRVRTMDAAALAPQDWSNDDFWF